MCHAYHLPAGQWSPKGAVPHYKPPPPPAKTTVAAKLAQAKP